MDLRPVFQLALAQVCKNRRFFESRTNSAVLAGLIATGFFLLAWLQPRVSPWNQFDPVYVQVWLARTTAVFILFLASVLNLGVAATQAGKAIALERERGTLDALLLTNMTPLEIVAAKLAGACFRGLLCWLAVLPAFVLIARLTGFTGTFWLILIVASLTTAVAAASLAIAGSARAEKVPAATSAGTLFIGTWLAAPLWAGLLQFLAARYTPGALSDLTVGLFMFLSRSSPLSPLLLLELGPWSLFGERMVQMIGLQVLVIVFGIGLAAKRLVPVAEVKAPVQQGLAFAVPRTPCSDDPIYWRDYEFKRGINLLRAAAAIPNTMLSVALLIIFQLSTLLVLGISFLLLLGIVAGTVGGAWYFAATLKSAWLEFSSAGFSSAGVFASRQLINVILRTLAAICGVVLASSALSGALGICTERDKQTWTLLLTTPLEDWEYIQSKIRAGWSRVRVFVGVSLAVGIVGAVLRRCASFWTAGLQFVPPFGVFRMRSEGIETGFIAGTDGRCSENWGHWRIPDGGRTEDRFRSDGFGFSEGTREPAEMEWLCRCRNHRRNSSSPLPARSY